jgi:hypothetical protein
MNSLNIEWFRGPSVRSLRMRAAAILSLAYAFAARANA